MSEVWTNKQGASTSSWTGRSTTESSTWTDASGDTSIGTTTPAGQSIGVYDSAQAAATSLIGTKYHLFDQKEFFFGDDSDIRLSFDGDNSGLLLRVFPPLAGTGTLFTVRNGDLDTFRVMGDRTIRMKKSYLAPSNLDDASGEVGMIFYNDNLWIYT